MRYDIEFGKWVREHPTDVSAIGINALLDEIDRLQAYAMRLLSDETRTWHCPKCGHEWFSNALVGKTYAVCPECETPMRPKAELMQEEIDRLTAELEKYRWIPVSERLPDVKKDTLVLCAIYYNHSDQYMIDARTYWKTSEQFSGGGIVTHWQYLPEPPKEEA